MIKLILYNYWRITLFRETPENTPYSPLLMGVSGLLFIFVMITQWSVSDLDISDDLFITIPTAASLALSFAVYTYAVLFFKGLKARMVQTTTCLFFANVIIHSLAIPLVLLDPYLVQTHLKNPLLLFIGVLYLFITLGLSVWQFVVTAHIYRYALNTTAIQSVLAAFGLIAVNILTISFWR